MTVALILGGILISVLIANQISKTEEIIKAQAKKELMKDVEFKHRTLTQNIRNDISNRLASINSELYTLSNSVHFRRMNHRKIREEADSLLKKDPNILEFKIINDLARADYAHCTPEILYSNDLGDLKPEVVFQDGLERYISKTFFDIDTRERYNYLGVPIRNNQGNIQSALMVRYSLDFIVDSIQKQEVAQVGNFFILDHNNRLVAQTNGRIELNKYESLPVSQKMLLFNQISGTNWDNNLLSFFRNKLDWTFALETSNAQATAPIDKRLNEIKADFDKTIYKILLLIALVLLLIVIIFAFIGVRVAKSVTQPISNLIDGVKKVSEGNLDINLPNKSNDDIGELTVAFNNMTQSLKQYKEKIEQHTKTITHQAQKLSYSNEELKQYAHTVSHDLKSPLRMISSYIGLLNKKYGEKFDDDAKEYFNYITNGTKRMNTLIEDMLAYARLDQNIKREDFRDMDLDKVIQNVTSDLKWQIEENDAKIHYTGLPIIYAHPSQMHSLFQNLISNSIKYRSKAPPEITISLKTTSPTHSTIVVSDNGQGIEKEYLKDIFKPFKRLVANDEVEGSGIGLATVKKILIHHQGKIKVESTVGKGTTFLITLPNLEIAKKQLHRNHASKASESILKPIDNKELVHVTVN